MKLSQFKIKKSIMFSGVDHPLDSSLDKWETIIDNMYKREKWYRTGSLQISQIDFRIKNKFDTIHTKKIFEKTFFVYWFLSFFFLLKIISYPVFEGN